MFVPEAPVFRMVFLKSTIALPPLPSLTMPPPL
jgi:hypothetical protein